MEIPYQSLAKETLIRVIESFVLREGTDYGEKEVDLADKIAQVHSQIEKGEILITYDPETSSVNLISNLSGNRQARPNKTTHP